MLKSFNIADHKLVECPDDTGQVLLFINPDEEEKKFLITKRNIDEHTLQSALDPDELARLEFEPEHAAVILKMPKNYSAVETFLFRVSSFGMFWFKDQLIIAVSDSVNFFERKHFNKVSSVSDVALKIIYASIIHYVEHLKIINAIAEEIEQKINKSMENRHLLNMFTLQKSLVYYLNAINSNSAVIDKIKINASRFNLTTENLELLDDLIIESNQCYKQAEIYTNILAGLMDARASIVNNNLNLLMKTLNIITIGIMVPTFVVSAFSMNVHIPLSENPFAFWIIMALACVSVVMFFFLGRFKKW